MNESFRPRRAVPGTGRRTIPQFEHLETRHLLAASILFDAATGIVTVNGDQSDNQAFVTAAGTDRIQVDLTGVETRQFDRSEVTGLVFNGRRGDDEFRNETDVPGEMIGAAGNDLLVGGSGIDRIFGGNGQDTIMAGAGNDHVDGGRHNDIIHGGPGDDWLSGGAHDDLMYGDEGNDYLLGYYGADTIYGNDGDDQIFGFTDNDQLYGGSGNDEVFGQHGDDLIEGDAGDDRLGGGDGDDTIRGGAGADLITGDDGHDNLQGEAGNDILLGWFGNDSLLGGTGDDLLFGQQDDDIAGGGDGNDSVLGGDGNDQLSGDAGTDFVYGEDGNDRVRGGAAVDYLSGGAGHDSLFAGATTGEAEYLFGNGGHDRFLTVAGDSIADFEPGDARLVFINQDSQWNDAEIETADRAFQRLFSATGNTRLLRESLNDKPLEFYKAANLGGAAGINSLSWRSWTTCNASGCTTTYDYTRRISIAEWDENNSFVNDFYIDVFVHEIGHNWDSELELTSVSGDLAGTWNSFLAIADWRDSDPGPGYTRSADGQWWYGNSAWFYDNYGRTNPHEDMATSWEYYFEPYQAAGDHSLMQPRLDILDAVMAELSQLI